MLGLLCCLPNFHFCWCCSWCSFHFPKRAIFMLTSSLWAVSMPSWNPTQQTGLLQMTNSANVKLLLLDKIYYLFGCLSCIFLSFLTVAIKSPSVLWENHDCRPLCGWARCGWHLLVSWFLRIGKLGALFVCLLGFGFVLVLVYFSSLSVEFFLVFCVLWFNYVVNILDSVTFLKTTYIFFFIYFLTISWTGYSLAADPISYQFSLLSLPFPYKVLSEIWADTTHRTWGSIFWLFLSRPTPYVPYKLSWSSSQKDISFMLAFSLLVLWRYSDLRQKKKN